MDITVKMVAHCKNVTIGVGNGSNLTDCTTVRNEQYARTYTEMTSNEKCPSGRGLLCEWQNEALRVKLRHKV